MKLLRYGAPGAEKPGILDDGQIRDLSGFVSDISGATLDDNTLAKIRALDLSGLPLVQGGPRIGACVGSVGKFICIGLNFADHAAELGMELPDDPVVFLKATSAICGPEDDIEIPPGSLKTDWEVELAVVIGKHAKNIDKADAMAHVAGYCVANDISERDFQLARSGQWTKGKSCDTFGPIGPWLVTRDEISDPQNLAMFLEVNGQRYQDGSTGTMHFGVADIVARLSKYMSLQPGDIISTGTPPGVGTGQTPAVYLKSGDRLEFGIEALGIQRHDVRTG